MTGAAASMTIGAFSPVLVVRDVTVGEVSMPGLPPDDELQQQDEVLLAEVHDAFG